MTTLAGLAASQLHNLLQVETEPNQGLGIFVQGGGCADWPDTLAFEPSAREDDAIDFPGPGRTC